MPKCALMQVVLMEMSDLQASVTIWMVVLRSATMECGELFVIVDGMLMMLKWCADNLDIQLEVYSQGFSQAYTGK